uniref:Interleukin 17-like protein n=2 Tax=Pygocentrus nattereri TaxID=42514 RepID=A0AAR2IRL3_PYGNA
MRDCFTCVHHDKLQRCDNENLTNFMFKTLNPGYENDSLSPWTYEDDVNDNRYPRIIRVAKCDPLGCSGLNATSEAITIEIPVFMRVKCGQHSKSNTAVYRLTLVPHTIAVGCTCIKMF